MLIKENFNTEKLLTDQKKYDQTEYKSLNETPVYNYNINENLNDGWDKNFSFEVRVNGELITEQPYHGMRMNKNKKQDLNGLNKYLDEEDLLTEQYNYKDINKPSSSNSFNNVSIVSLELFERINKNDILSLKKFIK